MKTICKFCGNNPVPHGFYWFNESLNILLTPIRQKVLYNPVTRLIKRSNFDQAWAKFFLSVGEGLKIIRRNGDINKCKVPRAQVLWQQGDKRGIMMEELVLFGKGIDVYVARKSEIGQPKDSAIETRNSQPEIIFSGLPRPLGYTNPWLDLMDDKAWLKKILLKNNFPVPAGAAVTSFGQAKKIFEQITKPVIVKPRAGSRGRHSTTFVTSLAELRKAFKVAKQLCYWVIVEEQLMGPVYRATLVDFKLEGVLRGDPPQVIGDGNLSIAELIGKKNQEDHEEVKDITDDESARMFLSRQNLTISSVPKPGTVINLSEKIGVNYGGSSSEDFEICHPDNKKIFVQAAKVLGDPIVGFDFIIPDIAKSYKLQKSGFIEVNSLPFINLHHDPLHGQPRNVAAKVWDMVGW